MNIVGSLFGILGEAIQGDSEWSALSLNTRSLATARQQELDAATDALRRGSIAAGRARMQGSALVAKQRVAFANSGVNPYSGTAANTAASSYVFNEFDALTIENNAAREALGYKRTANRYDEQRKQLIQQYDINQSARYLRMFTAATSAAVDAVSLGAGG